MIVKTLKSSQHDERKLGIAVTRILGLREAKFFGRKHLIWALC